MKKIFIVLAFLGLFTLLTPKIAVPAETGCHTIVLACPNGTQHVVIVCEPEDWYAWGALLCGITYGD